MEHVTELEPSLYQVFINHRGPDTKTNIASLLDKRLTRDGLHVFLDKGIHAGTKISPAIVSAIRSASVHITIFSPKYADSNWCLEEYFLIKESSESESEERRSKIIPVFYDVEPADLRHIESRCYAAAFARHERLRRYPKEQVKRWKEALKEAAEIKGFIYKRKESNQGEVLEVIDQGEVLEDIVKMVWKWVKFRQLKVVPYSVGLEQAADKFINTINYNSELKSTKIVTIAGKSGMGKSTLAKYLFHNSFKKDFPRASFLSEVRNKHFPSFQRQLVHDLLGSNLDIKNSSEGKNILQNCLQRHRVLIVLDQVDHMDEIDSLLDMNEVGCGSLILVTSRDKYLLEGSSVNSLIYEVQPLDREHARELFCHYAFLQPNPPGSEHFVERILGICGGLPSSLIVWGKHIRQARLDCHGMRDSEYWNKQLEIFSNRLPPDIRKRLKMSYEVLNNDEKGIFLDIACFLAGEDKDLVVSVLEGLDYQDARYSVESLCNQSLVGVDYDVLTDHEIECGTELEPIDYEDLYLPPPKGRYKIIIQDEVKLLARDLAEEEFRALKTLRLSCLNNRDVMSRLQDDADSSIEIRGIRIRMAEQNFLPEAPICGKGVRFFVLEAEIDLSSFFGLWDMRGELVWLRLRNFGSMYFPSAIKLSKLRVLELQCHGGYLEQLFQRFVEPACNLSELTIRVKDSTFPSTSSSPGRRKISDSGTAPYFSRFLQYIGTNMKDLQKIVLKNIKSLKSLPINFGELKRLTHLDLSGCTNLTQLPPSFSKLQQLQYLALRQCSNLSFETTFLGETSMLEYADFKGCAKLIHLPEGLVSRRSLRYLNLLSTRLLQFPEMLELVNLEQLRIGSPDLPNLPGSVGNLRSLKELVLIECRDLNRILQEGIAWPNIKVLAIESCPISEFRFQDQGTMDVDMPFLRDFSLKNTSISEIFIPESVSRKLETVDLSINAWLVQVNGLPSTLVTVNLEGCSRLKTLKNLSNLVNLKFLNLNRCVGLETFDVQGLTSLEEIKAEGCLQLHSIKQLSEPKPLNSLRISTHNGDIWNDILQFLASPSMSAAMFCGKTDNDMLSHESVMQSILNNFEDSSLLDVPATTTAESPVRLNNIRSHSAILMCFITNGLSGTVFHINFERSNSRRQYDVYETLPGDGVRGRSLHVFMWTEDSKLVKDENFCNKVDVYRSVNDCNNFSLDVSDDGSVNESDGGLIEKGWIVTLQRKTHVPEVCRRVVLAFGPYQLTDTSGQNEFTQPRRDKFTSWLNEFTRLRRYGMLNILRHNLTAGQNEFTRLRSDGRLNMLIRDNV